MSTYRFVGTHTEIGERKLTKFGQPFELADDRAPDVIGTTADPGAPLLPSADFERAGFTEQELSLHSDPLTHAVAHPAFLEKKTKALIALHELRESFGNTSA